MTRRTSLRLVLFLGAANLVITLGLWSLLRVGDPALPLAAPGVGLLFAILVPSIVHFAGRARLRETQAKEAYSQLQAEIAERMHLEDQLRQSQKMEAIGKLAGGVAHDFNNLLTVITGYSDMVVNYLEPTDPLYVPLEQIRLAGERAAGLTRQLLAFSRKQILAPKVISLNSVIPEVEKMLRRVIGEHIELLTALEPDLHTVKADPGQIEQVLLNLAVNARDAMPEGGKLLIETANVELGPDYAENHPEVQPGRYVMLAVSDSGCGIEDDIKAHIFEPFFTTKEVGKGTGMGLATVYGIVKQSGGSVSVYTEPGKGTSFKVYLPSLQAECPKAIAPAEIRVPRGTETILVVEDEEAVRGLTCRALQMSGYEVLEACRPDEALELCRQSDRPIDLLVTDVVMPQMSGTELAARILDLSPSVKLLFVSGYTDNAIIQHGLLGAESSFLHKPFTPAELARTVREVLDQQATACAEPPVSGVLV